MDITQDFKDKILAWFAKPAEERDLTEGALLVGSFTRNRILQNNMLRNPERMREKIEWEMEKIHNYVLAEITIAQVNHMSAEAEVINKAHRLDETDENFAAEVAKGKRADHDSLPAEIQKCYTDNLDLLYKMRANHSTLRAMPEDGDVCHAADRYPLLKELREWDIKYHENWKKYDEYVLGEKKTTKRTAKASK